MFPFDHNHDPNHQVPSSPEVRENLCYRYYLRQFHHALQTSTRPLTTMLLDRCPGTSDLTYAEQDVLQQAVKRRFDTTPWSTLFPAFAVLTYTSN